MLEHRKFLKGPENLKSGKKETQWNSARGRPQKIRQPLVQKRIPGALEYRV